MSNRVTVTPINLSDKTSSGVTSLLEDLQRLSEDRESADVLFLVGREETPVYAHRIILAARCKSFQNLKRGEVCKIPGCTVAPSAPGAPTAVRLAHFPGPMFHNFISYIYTGKLHLQEADAFEMLAMAQEMGVEALRVSCEEHVTAIMTPHNACTFLAAALEVMERVPGSKGSKPCVDRCISYVGENASECVKSSAFLNISKEAVLKLISSDHLALEEEEVWRALLCWAKFQAGVAQPTAHWNEEERVRVCHQLSGVVNHVRLLLIDSQVFAEEVEPTGAVPMELSLERYRYAALPSKFRDQQSEDKKLQPRLALKHFPGSTILIQQRSSLQRVLNGWFGVPKQQWRLVFQASSHGFSADAFHRHCDGVAPTYVVIMGTSGKISGGFSDVPWGQSPSKGRYVASDKAFLFSLSGQPSRFMITKRMFAICYHPDCGPIFGAGADLLIASNCDTNGESYSNLPHSYDGDGASCSALLGDYNFVVVDYEVFTPEVK